MRLGIDFGTTRIVLAAADRGNYPIVQFESPDGDVRDWFPPLVAARGNERRYGWQAWDLQADPEWTIVRSVKRILSHAGPQTELELGDTVTPLQTVLQELTTELRVQIQERSNAPGDLSKLEVHLGVPANANTNQRFLTAEAFRWGGFDVLGLLNEPSAAAIEYAHLNPVSDPTQERYVLVYDLGGGTFDVSLVRLLGSEQTVLSSEGISTLGGDDFDDLLAESSLEAAGVPEEEREEMSQTEWFRLREECRQKKEGVKPNSRRIIIDLAQVREGWDAVSVPVDDFYERSRPAVDETLHAVEDLLNRNGFQLDGSGTEDRRIETVYVAGGGSELPLVPRGLRESFGRRVRRSAHGRSSTAIGLAVQADAAKGYVLRDRFTRYFGVYREGDSGREITFDPLFWKEAALPASGEEPLRIQRSYQPVHNVGKFRYLECSHLTPEGQPAGDITLWDEIVFPFDPGLRGQNLGGAHIEWCDAARGQTIEETYTCDSSGKLAVRIGNLTAQYADDFRIGRWASSDNRLKPGRRGAARKGRSGRASKSARSAGKP
ncbi:MAG: Hsp70 family protein [Acidobacteria bacterium]|nr:Hsp70 family protein [Acidobacteriota bacterium]